MAPRQILSSRERAWAPFRYSGPIHLISSYDLRESFYCHGYRQEGEHYHKTMEQMEDCPLLRAPGWKPPERKRRRKR